MDHSQITHIIFDLGGVLVDLDTHRTVQAFQHLSDDPTIDWSSVLSQPLLLDYEQGFISDEEFREGVREVLSVKATDQQIDDAWNSMILEFPENRFPLLKSLEDHYQLLLLSNTNEIHLRHVNDKIQKHNVNQIDDLFTTAYYSQRLKMRKPNVEIFEEIINLSDLDPSTSVFIDDNAHNIEGAKQAGLHAHHLTDIHALPAFFNGWH